MLWNSDSSLAFLAKTLCSIGTYSFCAVASWWVCSTAEMQNVLQDGKEASGHRSCQGWDSRAGHWGSGALTGAGHGAAPASCSCSAPGHAAPRFPCCMKERNALHSIPLFTPSSEGALDAKSVNINFMVGNIFMSWILGWMRVGASAWCLILVVWNANCIVLKWEVAINRVEKKSGNDNERKLE